MDGDRWDILAVAPSGQADRWQPMLKALLVERFRLRARVETRERSIYRLVMARDDRRLGPRLTETACQPDAEGCGRTSANTNGIRSGTLTIVGRTPEEFSRSLSPYVERQVTDGTGLKGRYDLELVWSQDVSIFTALLEQLGLKVESTKGPVDVVVIDGVERPEPD